MHFSKIATVLAHALFVVPLTQAATWPNGPFHTSGRWILNNAGANVTYAGVNWPGAADTMIPEGLQYQSIATIVSKIKSLGMNVIRLTFAIEMIDDILDNGGDVLLKNAFTKVLGTTNGATVYNAVLKYNPQFNSTTTRLQVFDAIAAECFNQQIYVHLDNHMSRAEWCCSETDGNAWFGDTYFDIVKWKRGLQYMVRHGASWGSLMSVGMRNELRNPTSNSALSSKSYGWKDWYTNMVAAAATINTANPNVLIFFSGLNYDTDLSPIPTASSLGGGEAFRIANFAYQDKIVLELHNYQTSVTSCSSLESGLYQAGFDALSTTNSSIQNVIPVVMTEWGHSQDMTAYQSVYATCLHSYLPSQHAGWIVWVIAGSYYIRSGTQDYDETWGLLSHDWSTWRYSNGINNGLKPMIAATVSG
ncbi:glycoside hydrolase family 5 protein [Glonium stellatum]|uniref:Glycoside hydrolase family 5 protein n=1 Tax=Glonium stellatum TaxID=574774 RepID=A0A8E2F2C1_9PEZI|nr:glycoside hydrolase family 5 protein [Glonium stellatum]